jgi:hypothetical protein
MASWKRFAMILLGWYPIIAPPRATQGVFHPDFSALVSDRVRLRLFDRASQCEASRIDCGRKPPETLPLMLDGMKDARATMNAAQCVVTNDPRMKTR